MHKTYRMCGLAGFVMAAAAAFGGEPITGKIESVILYRGQALVTRAVPVNLRAGAAQVVVDELPEYIVAESLYCTAEQGVQIRAVRYRADAVEEAPRDEVRALDAQLDALEADIRKNQDLQKTQAEQIAFLGKLDAFAAPTAQVELSKGVLNANTLKELTLFMFEQKGKLGEAAFTLSEALRAKQKQLDLLRAKRAEITKSGSRAQRQALVFLDKAADGPVELRLHYLVSNATWLPAYNFKASGDLKNVQVEYNALVQQMSGESWDDVALTLSTGSPAMVSDAPAPRLSSTAT